MSALSSGAVPSGRVLLLGLLAVPAMASGDNQHFMSHNPDNSPEWVTDALDNIGNAETDDGRRLTNDEGGMDDFWQDFGEGMAGNTVVDPCCDWETQKTKARKRAIERIKKLPAWATDPELCPKDYSPSDCWKPYTTSGTYAFRASPKYAYELVDMCDESVLRKCDRVRCSQFSPQEARYRIQNYLRILKEGETETKYDPTMMCCASTQGGGGVAYVCAPDESKCSGKETRADCEKSTAEFVQPDSQKVTKRNCYWDKFALTKDGRYLDTPENGRCLPHPTVDAICEGIFAVHPNDENPISSDACPGKMGEGLCIRKKRENGTPYPTSSSTSDYAERNPRCSTKPIDFLESDGNGAYTAESVRAMYRYADEMSQLEKRFPEVKSCAEASRTDGLGKHPVCLLGKPTGEYCEDYDDTANVYLKFKLPTAAPTPVPPTPKPTPYPTEFEDQVVAEVLGEEIKVEDVKDIVKFGVSTYCPLCGLAWDIYEDVDDAQSSAYDQCVYDGCPKQKPKLRKESECVPNEKKKETTEALEEFGVTQEPTPAPTPQAAPKPAFAATFGIVAAILAAGKF